MGDTEQVYLKYPTLIGGEFAASGIIDVTRQTANILVNRGVATRFIPEHLRVKLDSKVVETVVKQEKKPAKRLK